MSSLVFGCPNCQQPFQVAATQAGQVVQCPSCAQTVEIPASAFADAPQPPTPPAPEEPMVFACPACQGQFGITQSMNGQKVACPHCQAPTLIQFQNSEPPQETAPPQEADSEAAPAIKTDVSISKQQKREIKKRAKSKQKSKSNKDLFAPTRSTDPIESRTDSAPDPGPLDSPSPQQETANTEAKSDSSTKPPKATTSPPIPTPRLKPKRRLPTQSESPDNTPSSPTSESTDKPKTAPTPSPPETVTESDSPSALETVEAAIVETEAEVSDPRKSIAHLLPPKFSVLDPSRLRVSTGADQFKVMLPDGKGGMAQMDNRVLRVNHGDEKVSLVSLTPQQKARRRLIQNIIAILIGIAVMALAFTILT